MLKNIFFLFSVVFIISCSNSGQENSVKEKESLLPPSTGSHTEILMIIDDDLYHGNVGKELIKTFASEQYGLPQPEATFRIIQVETKDANYLLKRNKSILIVAVAEDSGIKKFKNEWAKPQLITTIKGKTEKEIIATIKSHAKDLVSNYKTHDLSIVSSTLKKQRYKPVPKELSSFGIKDIVLPRSFRQTVEKPTLKIYLNQAIRTDQYLLFYKRPIDNQATAGQDIITVRDSVGKHYFEGSRADSYMITEMDFPPSQQVVEINGLFAVETRGLWKTHGDLMGGPFLSYSIYNDATNEVFTVEAKIYAPNEKKRNVLLELETIMKSIVLK